MTVIDYTKAFDFVDQKFILQALKDQGIQDKYVKIIRYTQNNNYVKIKCQFVVENFRVERGVKPCEPIVSELFACLSEHI